MFWGLRTRHLARFDVHTFVLRLSSGFFRNLLESTDAEATGKCTLDRDPHTLELLLPFLYCRKLDDILSLSASELYEVFTLADRLDRDLTAKHPRNWCLF